MYEENTLIKSNALRLALIREYLGRIFLQRGFYKQAFEQFDLSKQGYIAMKEDE